MLPETHKVVFVTGRRNTKKGKRAIDINKIVEPQGAELCSALPALHAFTGQDSLRSFVSIGKLKPIKILKKNPAYINAFLSLGTSPQVSDDLVKHLEGYTCNLYKSGSYTDINKSKNGLVQN